MRAVRLANPKSITISGSRFCTDCGINEVGDGKVCVACPPGTEPNAASTVCVDCAPGDASSLGVCQPCQSAVAPERGSPVCLPCADMTRPNYDNTGCVCAAGGYNATALVHVCFHRGYDDEHFNTEMTAHQTSVAEDCESCPTDEAGSTCLQCNDGRTLIAPGFTVPVLPERAAAASDFVSVFRCHHDMEVAVKRCPGTNATERDVLERDVLESDVLASESLCAPGYEGYICGECVEGFGMSSKNECQPCEEAGFTWETAGITVGSVAAVIVLFGALGRLWQGFPLQHIFRCAFQPMRILITYSQVTSQLGDVLDFQYPGIFGDVIAALKPIMDIWGLLFRALGPSECFGLHGFTSRWLLRVVGLPGVMSFIVLIIYFINVCRDGNRAAKANAKGNMFFVVFFCYPTITIVSVAAFICRPLTRDTSVLELDDAVICEDPSHVVMQWFSGAVVVIVAVGLPVFLGLLLTRKAKAFEKNTRRKYADVAKRLSTEMSTEERPVDVATAEYVIRDVAIGRDFSFVMDAFDPRYLYWEGELRNFAQHFDSVFSHPTCRSQPSTCCVSCFWSGWCSSLGVAASPSWRLPSASPLASSRCR